MNSSNQSVTDLEKRHLANDVSVEEVVAERERLLDELGLVVIEEFDSAKKTGGKKEVFLCKNKNGEEVIFRIGERRADWFFKGGYRGDHLCIPKILTTGGERIPYEVEEFIEGTMLNASGDEKEWSSQGKTSSEAWSKLLPAFWEFQKIASELPFENIDVTHRIKQYCDSAKDLIPAGVESLIDKHQAFWSDFYPSKWKFATDNLILDDGNRLVFIDNARAAGRYFGYDLGWIVWPRWVEMKTELFDNVVGNLEYLAGVRASFVLSKPEGVATPQDLGQTFDLMLLERLLGSLFDVKREVRHFEEAKMLGGEGKVRREAHTKFLQALLSDVVTRL